MSRIATVGLIATWRGEQLLRGCVESLVPNVDAVVVLDGAYRDVAGYSGQPDPWTPAGELVHPRTITYGINFALRPWRDEIAKRNVLLELGRAAVEVAPQGRYAVVLDEDEVLVNGHLLHAYLDGLPPERRRVPGLWRVEPDGAAWWAPSRLFYLSEFVRYAGRSYWLKDPRHAAERVSLEHGLIGAVPFDPDGVHVKHRWNERSEWRAAVQREWGRRLAELDHGAG